MIPENFIEQWRKTAPWSALAMVEQDLIISKALVDLYNQPVISNSLVFRGGTALNKLYIQPSARYSEDIDFVQINAEPIGNTITVIRQALDNWLGEPKRKLTERSVKLIYHYQTVDNTTAKLKIEINTTEHFNVQPLKKVNYSVQSEWFSGQTELVTYELDELMATKLRALYQRRKGRDLFDLWLVLKNKLINPKKTVEIFNAYADFNKQPITRALFEKNLLEKEQQADFGNDMTPLLAPTANWSVVEAFNLVREELLSYLTGEQWKSKNLKQKLY